jgi:ribosomal protein S1
VVQQLNPAVHPHNAMSESFADLFEESQKRSETRIGEVVTAEVVRIEHNFVVVNAGLKSEAYVPLSEFKSDKGELEVQVGEFVSVAIVAMENGYGDTIVSRDTAKRLASWMSLEKSLESGEFVTGTTSGKVKGGLTVLVNGIRAFLPVRWSTPAPPRTCLRTRTRPWNSRSSSSIASATTSCCRAVRWSRPAWAKNAPS